MPGKIRSGITVPGIIVLRKPVRKPMPGKPGPGKPGPGKPMPGNPLPGKKCLAKQWLETCGSL